MSKKTRAIRKDYKRAYKHAVQQLDASYKGASKAIKKTARYERKLKAKAELPPLRIDRLHHRSQRISEIAQSIIMVAQAIDVSTATYRSLRKQPDQ